VTPSDRVRADLLNGLAAMGDALADRVMKKAARRPYWWEDPEVALAQREALKDQAIVFNNHAIACREQAAGILTKVATS
jgi:hypothetical protein